MAGKIKEGRPATWTDPIVLKKLIDNYFDQEDKPTLAGLAVALGVSRSTLYEYSEKDEFSDIIKEARDKVIRIYEERLIYSNLPTGVIFALKNTGWRDRVDSDITSGGEKIVPLIDVRNNHSNSEAEEAPKEN